MLQYNNQKLNNLITIGTCHKFSLDLLKRIISILLKDNRQALLELGNRIIGKIKEFITAYSLVVCDNTKKKRLFCLRKIEHLPDQQTTFTSLSNLLYRKSLSTSCLQNIIWKMCHGPKLLSLKACSLMCLNMCIHSVLTRGCGFPPAFETSACVCVDWFYIQNSSQKPSSSTLQIYCVWACAPVLINSFLYAQSHKGQSCSQGKVYLHVLCMCVCAEGWVCI